MSRGDRLWRRGLVLGGRNVGECKKTLGRRSQPLGEETTERIHLFWLRETAFGYDVGLLIRLVYNEKRRAFLPANQMSPGQLLPSTGAGRLDAGVRAN